MRLIGEAARDRIIDETQAGKDQEGRRFKPYSPLYARIRSAAGYGTAPDLTLSGHMLNALAVVQVTADSVTLGFLDTQQPDRKSLIERAWPRLSDADRQSVWRLAVAAKRRAGKKRETPRRRAPSVERTRRQGPIPSGHPAPLPSEKARFTNRLRPWFGFGRAKRRAEIVRRGTNILIEALTGRPAGDN